MMDVIYRYRPAFLDSVPPSFQIVGVAFIALVAYTVYSAIAAEQPLEGFPIAALTERRLNSKWSWYTAGGETIARGLKEFNNSPFQILTGTGPKIVLPNRFADEVRSRQEANFPKAFEKEFFVNYPGFDAHRQGLLDDWFIQELARVKLTQSLGLITHDLVDETTASVHDIFGEDAAWHTIPLKSTISELVTRLSSRVFLGLPLCRNERWLHIAQNYTVDAFVAARLLRMVPGVLRPFAYLFIPQCHRLRSQVSDARKLIMPEIEVRKARAEKALEAGQKPPKAADAIGWMVEIARGRDVDYVAAQLSLTMAAIHTTTEATAQAIADICQHPEVVQPLREEIISVISENGWTKPALQKLRLMDSFLKESQRCTPIGIVSMNRFVEKEFELSDGTVLPTGSRFFVAGAFQDPLVYKDPEKFDAFRFHRKLEPGQINSWAHVTTSASHMGFGHGQHACPGRFFASNEIKVALCHLLLKYDWDLVDGEVPQVFKFESNNSVSTKSKVSLRRRKEEIELDLEPKE
ncbi:hypothetical protein Q7P37_005798 [Cladosporium fusiforme]